MMLSAEDQAQKEEMNKTRMSSRKSSLDETVAEDILTVEEI